MKTSMAVRIGLSLAVICMAGVVALAQGMGGGPGFGEHRGPWERAMGPMGKGMRWWNDPAVVEKLKLTDDQRKAMDQVLQDHRFKLIDLRAAVEKAEVEMQPMMREDQPNEAQVLAQIDKVAQARAELEKANARFLFALRARLTPEQWKALRALREERREMRRDSPRPHRGRGGAEPQGPAPGNPPPADGGPGMGEQGYLIPDSGIDGPDGVGAGEFPDTVLESVPGAAASK